MRIIFIAIIFLSIAFLIIQSNLNITKKHDSISSSQSNCREICGAIERGETLFDIFKKYQLDISELLKLRQASADVHRLRKLYPGQP